MKFKHYNFHFYIIPIVLIMGIVLYSCSGNDDDEMGYVPAFTYEIDLSNPNMVNFTNTSQGDYLYLQWDYGKGSVGSKESDKTSVRSVNYPQKGSYEVTLTIWGSTNSVSDTKSVTKTIVIENDDPNYNSEETLIWSDEFEGTAVNQNNWTFEVGNGDDGWGNQELQYYTGGDNARVEDGKLIISAKKVNDNKVTGSYTSARMITWGKQEFTYGRIEVKAKLPSGKGVWPAIWMLGANLSTVGWPACGELDMMEYVGYQANVVHSTVHSPAGYGSNGDGNQKTLNTAEEEFHIYGMLWSEESIVFYIDSPENIIHTYAPAVKTSANWPFDKPQFFILNLAVGGSWGGAQGIDNSIFPQSLEVDYVRVYKLD